MTHGVDASRRWGVPTYGDWAVGCAIAVAMVSAAIRVANVESAVVEQPAITPRIEVQVSPAPLRSASPPGDPPRPATDTSNEASLRRQAAATANPQRTTRRRGSHTRARSSGTTDAGTSDAATQPCGVDGCADSFSGSGPAGEGDKAAVAAPDPGDVAAVVAEYRAVLSRWFSAHFRVVGTGLDPDELTSRRVYAVVDVQDDRTVVGFDVVPSGHRAFDAAARRALEATRGKILPAPPEGFPGPVQRRIRIAFVCRAGACD